MLILFTSLGMTNSMTMKRQVFNVTLLAALNNVAAEELASLTLEIWCFAYLLTCTVRLHVSSDLSEIGEVIRSSSLAPPQMENLAWTFVKQNVQTSKLLPSAQQ
ncbi:hypothetical protein FANTH_14543 [Fusarium anthophilum]|uniref:Uncharacterized protein n=1 Tax=Fusarium anthophilum TaxID=48485 RepID=A0A8H5DM03_9HYPO|nr:hypothetical protein FANTH_14543 [Fusarium anthophilum]